MISSSQYCSRTRLVTFPFYLILSHYFTDLTEKKKSTLLLTPLVNEIVLKKKLLLSHSSFLESYQLLCSQSTSLRLRMKTCASNSRSAFTMPSLLTTQTTLCDSPTLENVTPSTTALETGQSEQQPESQHRKRKSNGSRYETLDRSVKSMQPHEKVPQKTPLKRKEMSSISFELRRASSKSMTIPSAEAMIRRWLIPPGPSSEVFEIPPENLGSQEKKALAEISKLWQSAKINFKPQLSLQEESEYSDRAKLRYLRARDLDPKKALSMMVKTVIFRRKIGKLNATEIAKNNQKGALYRRGFDIYHRPMLYMRPMNIDLTHTTDEVLHSLVYQMDRAIDSMDKTKGIEQMVFIIDYNGYLMTHQPPFVTAQRCVEVFSDHYPERTAAVFVVDSPWYFKAFWVMIQPFLSERTKSKISFVNSQDEETMKPVLELIPIEHREEWLGKGMIKPPYYDSSIYWKAEIIHQKQLNEIRQQLAAKS